MRAGFTPASQEHNRTELNRCLPAKNKSTCSTTGTTASAGTSNADAGSSLIDNILRGGVTQRAVDLDVYRDGLHDRQTSKIHAQSGYFAGLDSVLEVVDPQDAQTMMDVLKDTNVPLTPDDYIDLWKDERVDRHVRVRLCGALYKIDNQDGKISKVNSLCKEIGKKRKGEMEDLKGYFLIHTVRDKKEYLVEAHNEHFRDVNVANLVAALNLKTGSVNGFKENVKLFFKYFISAVFRSEHKAKYASLYASDWRGIPVLMIIQVKDLLARLARRTLNQPIDAALVKSTLEKELGDALQEDRRKDIRTPPFSDEDYTRVMNGKRPKFMVKGGDKSSVPAPIPSPSPPTSPEEIVLIDSDSSDSPDKKPEVTFERHSVTNLRFCKLESHEKTPVSQTVKYTESRDDSAPANKIMKLESGDIIEEECAAGPSTSGVQNTNPITNDNVSAAVASMRNMSKEEFQAVLQQILG